MTQATAQDIEIQAAQSAVPDLVRTPALEIGAEDIKLPRLYIGHFNSGAVQARLAQPGSIYIADDKDDPDPVVLAEPSGAFPKGVEAKDGPVVHVISMTRGKSASVNGELERFDYDDPDAPEDSWVTYNYVVLVPGYDTEIPVKWLLTRSGRSAAQRINKVLKVNERRGPAWLNAFQIGTTGKSNDKGKWFVPVLSVVEPDDEAIAAATGLAGLISAAPVEATTSGGDEPAI